MTRPRRTSRSPRRSAVILATVLVLIALLALIMAGFMFYVRAETAGMRAYVNQHQARYAAYSGFEEVTALLRLSQNREDPAVWYNNPDRFKHRLVWGSGFDRTNDPLRDIAARGEALAEMDRPAEAWRYSVVAPYYDVDVEDAFRYGLTPESAKLNLNAATEEQITQLLTPLLTELNVSNPTELIQALLDWIDEDDDPREFGAEAQYYADLDLPYRPKNGPLDTIDELLMVRGFSAAVLYGEDVNRNGLLDANEDDGEETFPEYDNQDGTLNLGVAAFTTVWSREPDSAQNNSARINLYSSDSATVTALMQQYGVQLSAASQQFIASIAGTDTAKQMKSPAELYVGGATENVPAGLAASPVQADELPVIMNYFTVRSPEDSASAVQGLININAAPRRVLETIPGMTPEAASAILIGRSADASTRTSPDWPLTNGVIDADVYKAIAPYITTKSLQFHVEILGYADHVKLFRRYEWVIEMVGPVAQVRYHRDLTSLGMAWPIDKESPEITEQ